MYVIGTAGHVDHGKSTLVKALTGIDPDRLIEEKEREMTIDLGFAWLNINGQEIGIVDVPGHRDFIENMLAGVGGIDIALFVIAADEGVMPQTREHLAILDLLGIQGGIIVLTKVDLIDDPDWLELVTLEIHEEFEGTSFAEAPIIAVSSHSGHGIDELLKLLGEMLQNTPERLDNGRPRMAVDRVFTLTGFGTIVTGTLIGGQFRLGDSVEIQPGDKKARIRGLQTHKQKKDIVDPGSRVAINLTGIDRSYLQRGDVVAAPGIIGETTLLDVNYRHLLDARSPLKHNVEVKFFSGAAETIARTRIIGDEQIEPGSEGLLQLALKEPLALARGDRFILRQPSPAATIGGGLVMDPYPGRQYRRFRPEVIAHLQTLSSGTPTELILQTLYRLEPTTESAIIQRSGLEIDLAKNTLQEILKDGEAIANGNQIVSYSGWKRLIDQTKTIVTNYHQNLPLRIGIPREELRSRLSISQSLFNALTEECLAREIIVLEGNFLRDPTHQIQFSDKQTQLIDQVLQNFSRSGVNSPSVKETKSALGDDLYFALLDQRRLYQLNSEVVYASPEYKSITEKIIHFLNENGTINVAQTRDLFGTSRKYAIALLEHLDDVAITRRVDDYRELKPKARI